MELAVGKDLFALCGKCDATWHVIVAMEDGKVTKVQCKQCYGYHRYRTPPGEDNVNKRITATRRRVASPSSSRSSSSSRSTSSRSRRKTSASEPMVEPDMDRPVRRYSIRETYEPGDRIEHPKFGQGVVENAPEPGKVTVFFEDGRKTLIQGRGAEAS